MTPGPSAGEILVCSLIALFWGITVFTQFPGRWPTALRKRDFFALAPAWSFFAPEPGRNDIYLLFRDTIAGGAVTQWREIPLIRDRRWYNIFWSPERRLKKALFDSVSLLASEIRGSGADVRLSVPYLLLLIYVTSYPRLYTFETTQFLIMASSPVSDEEPVEVFMSERHSP